MSQARIKQLITEEQLICPDCDKPIKGMDKYVDTIGSVWDGAGDSHTEGGGSKVTLICGNCSWKERTEYWENYIK